MNTIILLITPFLISISGCFYLRQKKFLLDIPNDRSMHSDIVPRSGGIALFISFTVSILLLDWSEFLFVLYFAGIIPLAVVSLLDDLYNVSAGMRFIVHLLFAGMVISSGLMMVTLSSPLFVWPLYEPISWLISVLYMVWFINLFNFMDGSDGLAAMMAIIGLSCLLIFGLLAGDTDFVMLNVIIISALIGFLLFNWPPATLFLGDLGSIVLGAVVSILLLLGSERGIFPFWIGIVVFTPFIADATFTLLKRIKQGDNITQAHNSHYYQKLLGAGWSKFQLLRFEISIMLFYATLAVIMLNSSVIIQSYLFVFWLLITLILFIYQPFVKL